MADKSFEQELSDTFAILVRMRPGDDAVPDGVTSGEMKAMVSIHLTKMFSGTARPGAISEALHITKSAFSQTLKSLENKGLVVRNRSELDSRVMELEITPKGHELLEEGEAQRRQFMNALLDHVGHEDLEHCLRVMKKIIEFQEQSGYKRCDERPGDFKCM